LIPLLRPLEAQAQNLTFYLQFLVELARRAGNIDPAGHASLAVFHALDDARRLAALGTIRALARVHDLLSVRCFCNLRAYRHDSFLLMSFAQRSARIPRGHCGWDASETSTRTALARKSGRSTLEDSLAA